MLPGSLILSYLSVTTYALLVVFGTFPGWLFRTGLPRRHRIDSCLMVVRFYFPAREGKTATELF